MAGLALADDPPMTRWVIQAGGPKAVQSGGEFYEYLYDMALDSADNTYIGGRVWTNSIAGSFLLKHDRDGNFLWMKVEQAYCLRHIGFDPADNVYVVYNFKSEGYTNPIAGTNLNGEYVLAKYGSDGAPIWARVMTTARDIYHTLGGGSIAIDSYSNIYCIVIGLGSPIDLIDTNLNAGPYDSALLKYDTDGRFCWARLLSSTNIISCAMQMCLDTSGGVFVAGYFDSADFGCTNLTAPNTNSDIFVGKYAGDGTLLWIRQAGGTGVDRAYSLIADPQGNCFVTGTFFQNALFGDIFLTNTVPTNYIFVAKYDPNGNVLWVRQLCAGGNPYQLTTDYAGNCYFMAAPFGTNALALGKYDPIGNLAWTKGLSPGNLDYFFMGSPLPLQTDQIGNLYVAGAFIGPSLIWDGYILTNSRPQDTVQDIFLAKLDTTTPPLLKIHSASNSVQLSWSALAMDFYLESKSSASPDSPAISNTVPPMVIGLTNTVTLPISDGMNFYRLKRPH